MTASTPLKEALKLLTDMQLYTSDIIEVGVNGAHARALLTHIELLESQLEKLREECQALADDLQAYRDQSPS